MSDYGKEKEVFASSAAEPEKWWRLGATRATCIVACLPAFMDKDGFSTGAGMPITRGANMTTSKHVDASSVDIPSTDDIDLDEDKNAQDVPEDAVPFDVTAEDIQVPTPHTILSLSRQLLCSLFL